MTSEQLFHILGMRNVWKVLKEINRQPSRYIDIVNNLNINNALAYRLLLLLKNAGLIIRNDNDKDKTYYISDLGQRMVLLYDELDTPIKISWNGGDISELVI